MLQKVMKFIRDEEGATAIEYGLIIGLIAVLLVAALTLIGTDLRSLFDQVEEAIPTAATP
ncbi:MAG: Flp family type IVb pilin [Pseudomonadota bacterium]